MSQSEVQPLIPLILGSFQIRFLLFLGHSLPFPLPNFVSPAIIRLRPSIGEDVEDRDREKHLVTSVEVGQFVYVTE